MIDDISDQNEGFSQPTYDGRLKYHSVLQLFMVNIGMASTSMDLAEWYRLLRSMYSVVCPYIKIEDRKKLVGLLDDVKKRIDISHSKGYNQFTRYFKDTDKMLYIITDELYIASKHLFLPIEDAGKDDFDIKEWAEESDL